MTFRWIIIALLWLIAWSAHAASTINTTQPKDGVPFSPAIIRQNFGAAADDIAALQTMNAGASAPANPTLGTLWLATPQDGTIYTLNIWDGPGTVWVPIGALDVVNNIWMPPIGGGVLPALLSDATVDLGAVPQATVTVTGAQSIFSFGSSAPAGLIKFVLFSGTPVLVFNSVSMILPGLTDITTATGDIAIALSLGGGNWQVILYQPLAALIGVTMGGTGRTFLPFPSVLLGEGTNPIGFATPTTAGVPLLSTGPTTDAAFGPLDLSLPSVTNVLPVAHGGTGDASGPPHSVPIAQGSAAYTFAIPGVAGQLFGSFGPNVDPGFGVTISPGDLPLIDVPHGGTGQVSLGQHCALLGNGINPIGGACPVSGTNGFPLISNGPGADPSFQPCDLAGPCVTGALPLANLPLVDVPHGGTDQVTLPQNQLLFGNNTSPVGSLNGGIVGNVLTSTGPGNLPNYQAVGPLFGGVFTTVGTFTVSRPTVKITVCGGGGGGGGGLVDVVSPGAGGGGGGGGVAIAYLTGLTSGNTINVSVGSGGAGGTGGLSPTAGSGGGTSIVSAGTEPITTIVAGGGAGGMQGVNSGGTTQAPGGVGSGAFIVSQGASGGDGQTGSSDLGMGHAQAAAPTMGGVAGCPFGSFGTGGQGAGAGDNAAGNGTAGLGGLVVFEE